MDDLTRQIILDAVERVSESEHKEQAYEEAKERFRAAWLDHHEYAEAIKALSEALNI